jgi:putative CocE/NonD family hydrolase
VQEISTPREASQPVYDVRFIHDLKVPTRDGITLSADLFLPRAKGPFPTLLHRTPYESNEARWIKWGIWWAKRGYAAVSQDCRGRYQSEGTFNAYFDDGDDGRDTVKWLAEQPWCNGKIGTWGRSYGALTQWRLAPNADPHLTCMAPHAIGDCYFDDYHYVGGAFQLALSVLAMVVFAANTELLLHEGGAIFNRKLFRHLPLIDIDQEVLGHKVPFWRDWLEHPTYDDFWHALSPRHTYGQIDVPIFQQGGWYDPYAGGIFRMWNGMVQGGKTADARKNQKVLMGPWTHSEPTSSELGDIDFGPPAQVIFPEIELPWFDYWLKGLETGIMDEPPIKLFVMGANQWRFEHEWPLARTQFTPYYLHSGGRANSIYGDGVLSPEPPASEPPDRFDYDPTNPVPTVGGVHSLGFMVQNFPDPVLVGPVDQRPIERRDDVLVYTTPELEQDVEVTGPLELVLYAASSARDTDFTVSLVDVFPTGFAIPVAEGIIRGRFRHGFEQMDLLQPNEPDKFRIRMYPTSNLFKKGHRIRVHISSSNFPHFSRNLNTGEDVATGMGTRIAQQTILHTSQYPSHIMLPIIPAG